MYFIFNFSWTALLTEPLLSRDTLVPAQLYLQMMRGNSWNNAYSSAWVRISLPDVDFMLGKKVHLNFILCIEGILSM